MSLGMQFQVYVPFVNRPFEPRSHLTYFRLILYIVPCYRARLPCSFLVKFNKIKDFENALWYRVEIHTPIHKKLHSHSHSHAHSHNLDEYEFHTKFTRISHEFSMNLARI